MINKITWEITSENIFPMDADGADSEFSKLYDYMIARNPIDVYFGMKDETGTYSGSTTGDGLVQGNGTIAEDSWKKVASGFLYKGKVIITSLSLNATNGEEATYSATLTGVGSLTKVTA